MRIKGRTLAVVNTDARRTSSSVEATRSATSVRGASPGPSSLKPGQITEVVNPIIAENYVDTIKQLFTASYLYNPAFADNAEGWTISEEDISSKNVRLSISDNKTRLFLREGGSIYQSNELIRKPSKHEIYNHAEGTEENVPQDAEPSSETTTIEEGSIIIKTLDWEDIEAPVFTEGKEEKDDFLYLNITFVCHESGSFSIGFNGNGQTTEESLKYITQNVDKSDTEQTIEVSGTWDGTGNFSMEVAEGEVEVISLSLTDKPLDEYRKQTDSAILQIFENLGKIMKHYPVINERIGQIKTELNQLYENDSALDGEINGIKAEIDSINETLDSHDRRISSAYSLADSAYSLASSNSSSISSLGSSLGSLYSSIESLSSSVSSLSSRVSALESSSGGDDT